MRDFGGQGLHWSVGSSAILKMRKSGKTRRGFSSRRRMLNQLRAVTRAICRPKSRHRRFVDNIYTRRPRHGDINAPLTPTANPKGIDKLAQYAESSPSRLPRICRHLNYRLKRDIIKFRAAHVHATVSAYKALITRCDDISLFDTYIYDCIDALLAEDVSVYIIETVDLIESLASGTRRPYHMTLPDVTLQHIARAASFDTGAPDRVADIRVRAFHMMATVLATAVSPAPTVITRAFLPTMMDMLNESRRHATGSGLYQAIMADLAELFVSVNLMSFKPLMAGIMAYLSTDEHMYIDVMPDLMAVLLSVQTSHVYTIMTYIFAELSRLSIQQLLTLLRSFTMVCEKMIEADASDFHARAIAALPLISKFMCENVPDRITVLANDEADVTGVIEEYLAVIQSMSYVFEGSAQMVDLLATLLRDIAKIARSGSIIGIRIRSESLMILATQGLPLVFGHTIGLELLSHAQRAVRELSRPNLIQFQPVVLSALANLVAVPEAYVTGIPADELVGMTRIVCYVAKANASEAHLEACKELAWSLSRLQDGLGLLLPHLWVLSVDSEGGRDVVLDFIGRLTEEHGIPALVPLLANPHALHSAQSLPVRAVESAGHEEAEEPLEVDGVVLERVEDSETETFKSCLSEAGRIDSDSGSELPAEAEDEVETTFGMLVDSLSTCVGLCRAIPGLRQTLVDTYRIIVDSDVGDLTLATGVRRPTTLTALPVMSAGATPTITSPIHTAASHRDDRANGRHGFVLVGPADFVAALQASRANKPAEPGVFDVQALKGLLADV
ncbi:hypothetical protein J8273_4586 [Carpediemonas membranifera]|uniref:Uncharacterized protein n=1 Tax=Carpediemonas membranifera TaxID=201153 RepID=A0A8J6E279_9EUKA|nr:hypothetical protein J8273_4586 [Carpediemonas membranifera]|eukprot:KAG9393986.1 hypothetical protein J8273_4586 [Carpediemonas membranifera]